MSATVQVEEIRFACQPWLLKNGDPNQMRPVQGTWTLAPWELRKRGIHGILSCPRCAAASILSPNMGTLEHGVCVIPGFQCAKCGFICNVRCLDWDKRKLFCICYETDHVAGGKPVVVAHKHYTHAENRAEALFFFEQSTALTIKCRVVDCAPVIGYFFNEKTDKDARTLRAD